MKRLFIVLAGLLIAASASAQLGITAGLTSTATSIKDAAKDIGNVNLFHAGLCYKIPLAGNVVTLQPGVIYNLKGTKFKEMESVRDVNFEWKTGYIEVPVQLQIGFGIADVVRIYGIAEPFAGIAIHNTVTADGTTEKNTWDSFKQRLEWGASLGAGVELFKRVQVSVKYFWNFGNVFDGTFDGQDIASNFSSSKIGGISASVAVLLF